MVKMDKYGKNRNHGNFANGLFRLVFFLFLRFLESIARLTTDHLSKMKFKMADFFSLNKNSRKQAR